jgi:Protein of unknown function (DUF2530)
VTPAPSEHATSGPPPLEPLHVNVARLVLIGTAVWAVVLVLTLVVPGLHSGGRSWWPWTAVAGLVLGLAGLAYLHRGRGNAAAQ